MRRVLFWQVLIVFSCASAAYADVLPRLDPGVELQKQQELERLQRQLDTPPSALSVPQVPEKPRPTTTTCVQVRRIAVAGVTIVKTKDLDALKQPYEGRCLSASDINALLQTLNSAYIARGYIASRAYLPEQNVADGVLGLQVMEGSIESIQLNDDQSSASRRRIAAAFPVSPNQILRLQDIEQGVDQLNRAPSAQASVAIEPGSSSGSSRVVVKTVDNKSWRTALVVDNGGEEATGIYKLTASLEKDNLTDSNDNWQLAISRTDRSNAFSASVVVPFGYWTFNGSYSQSSYSNILSGGYVLTGEGASTFLSAERLVFRNKTDQLSLLLGLSDKDSGREIADVSLLPDASTTVRLSMRWLHRKDAASWLGQLAYIRGTSWRDATQDPSQLPDSFPHHQFNKLELQAQYSLQFSERWFYLAQWQAQYASQGLTGGEQIVLGGSDSVRGFETSAIFGDKGLSWRNQIGTACLPHVERRLQCFAFLDTGSARSLASPSTQTLLGGGLGARLDYPGFYAEVSAAVPVSSRNIQSDNHGELYFQLGARY